MDAYPSSDRQKVANPTARDSHLAAALAPRPLRPEQRQLLVATGVGSISPQARATSESVVLLPGMSANRLFSTIVPRSHELDLASAATCAAPSAWAAEPFGADRRQ